MPDPHLLDPPSPFIEQWIRKLASDLHRGRALDVAMGKGRHTLLMAAYGFKTFGTDLNFAAIAQAVARGRARGLSISVWCSDLTVPVLPTGRFDLIVVTRYLQRNLCRLLEDALTPGGFLLYETFTELQRRRGLGPRSPDHLLKAGELATLFGSLETVFYKEETDPAEDAVARLAARRRRSPS